MHPPDPTTGLHPAGCSSPARQQLEPDSHWIPAHNVFAARAAPLLLPALDRLIIRHTDPATTGRLSDPSAHPPLSPHELKTWLKFAQSKQPPRSLKAWMMAGDESPGNEKLISKSEQTHSKIWLPFHLLSPSLLKPITKDSNNSTLRDFLQLISLIAGLSHSTVSSTSSPALLTQIVLSKLPLFRRVVGGDSPPAHKSFRNYCQLLFRWVPGMLSLDLAAYAGLSPATSVACGCLLALLLCEFYRATSAAGRGASAPLKHAEGLDQTTHDRSHTQHHYLQRWADKLKSLRASAIYSTALTLVLVSLYVPVTRTCIEALVWASGYWPIPNVYITNDDRPATDVAEKLRAAWPGAELVNPAEFCYRTTLRKDTFDGAGLVLFLAVIGLLALGCWFPLRLLNTIRASSPQARPTRAYNSNTTTTTNKLGNHGSAPSGRFAYFCHPYKQADRWAPARDLISRFVLKLVVVVLATVPVKDTCIFIKRGASSRASIDLFRCLFLASTFLAFWIYQAVWMPYRYKSLNLIHDMNTKFCLLLSVVGAGSAIIHFQELLFGSILLIWTTLMYLLNIHYLAIHSKKLQRLISSFNRDLQIDESLFSADFDFRKEVIRRVWDESLCVLILGMPEYRMAEGKRLRWREEVPGAPCLVNFDGTHGERLVENVRLFEGLGAERYGRAAGQAGHRADQKALAIQSVIRSEFTGPDCFWKPHNAADLVGVTTFFGRADVVPFPFTVVFKYDQRPADPVYISTPADLRAFVAQNQNAQVQMRRKAVQATSKNRRWPRWLQGARSDVQFRSGVLRIHRNCQNKWQGYNCNSGFQVSIEYEDGQSTKVNGTTISRIRHTRLPRSLGLRDDFKVTPTLAKLFQDNHSIISTTLDKVDRALRSHRAHFARQAAWKQDKMSFAFLELFAAVHDQSLLSPTQTCRSRLLPQICRGSLHVMAERMEKINQSPLHQWWFVVFDDIYRRNCEMLTKLGATAEDFSPHHRGSLCYTPMARGGLERFLSERNLFEHDWTQGGAPDRAAKGSRRAVFHPGFLNRIYFHLDLFMFKERDAGLPDAMGNTQEAWLPRSTLYHGVYEDGQKPDGGRDVLARLGERLKTWLMLDAPLLGAAQAQESCDDDDGNDEADEDVEKCKGPGRQRELIKLGPLRNARTLDGSAGQGLPMTSDAVRRAADEAHAYQPASSSTASSSDDCSTYVDFSARAPASSSGFTSGCSTLDVGVDLTGYDITDEPDAFTDGSASTIYGFH
ncbi:hypothetical protein PtB15_6B58 [Puccinia triticina]|nr:hypothetical protein PtB15_6B58 [Puccinia triticina]